MRECELHVARALGWRRIDGTPVDLDDTIDYLDEHLAKAVLPHIPQRAFGRERQIGLGRLFKSPHDFGVERGVHGVGLYCMKVQYTLRLNVLATRCKQAEMAF